MKKIFLYLVLVSALLALIIGYFAFTSTTKFTSKSTTFIIDNINKQQISNLLVEKNIISNKTVFLWIGNAVGIWEKINQENTR